MASIADWRSSVRDGLGFTNPNVAVWTARRQPRAGRGLGGVRTGGGGSGGYGGGAGAIRGICTVGGPRWNGPPWRDDAAARPEPVTRGVVAVGHGISIAGPAIATGRGLLRANRS